MQAPPVPSAPGALPEDEGSACCGCMFKIADIPKTTKKVAIVTIVLHLVGFCIGHVPFFIVNFQGGIDGCLQARCTGNQWQYQWCSHGQSNCVSEAECLGDSGVRSSCESSQIGEQAFLTFVAIPTVIIWLLGFIASILMLPNICGCDTACSMCAVVGLSITSAVLHAIIGFIEAIIFWVSGLSGNGADWVAGLLLVKNLMCLASEIALAVVACGVQTALNNQKSAAHTRQAQMAQVAQMQEMMRMQAAAGMPVGVAPVVGQPAAGAVMPTAVAAGAVMPAAVAEPVMGKTTV